MVVHTHHLAGLRCAGFYYTHKHTCANQFQITSCHTKQQTHGNNVLYAPTCNLGPN